MAQLKIQPRLDVVATFTVNESELRALDALIGYGVDAFIKNFYTMLGEAYMKPHEAGLREFLGSIGKTTGPALLLMDQARKTLNK